MKVFVIGRGAAEHAIVWKLSQSKHINKIYCCPGNPGIAEIAECLDINPNNFRTLIDFVRYEWIDLTIVGSNNLLIKGIADAFEKKGCKILGSDSISTQFLTSRIFLKNLMRQYRIPTQEFRVFTSYLHAQDYIMLRSTPVVIKVDRDFGRNSVFYAQTVEDAINILNLIMKDRIFGDAVKRVIVEEYIQGHKLSLITITDGKTILPLADLFKHNNETKGYNDLNLTGMAAFSPTNTFTRQIKDTIISTILKPFIKALRSKGIHYKGILNIDLIISNGKPYVFDIKCCFQDPETQTILPRLETDLLDISFSIIEERLSGLAIKLNKKASICIVIFSNIDSRKDQKDSIIHGIENIKSIKDTFLFQGDTSFSNNKIVVKGKRVMCITSTASSILNAKKMAYKAIKNIYYDGMYYKKDISINKELI